MKKFKLLLQLFLTFFKIGLFTFGGGYAMISIIEDSCVEKKKWITHDEMMNLTVIAESTPGPIAINCSTYIGYSEAGIIGAIIATVGMVLPSFIIISIIASALDSFLEITFIANAFKGIKLAVGILILDAAVKMIIKIKKEKLTIAILTGSFVIMMLINIFALDFSTIALLLIAAAVSLAVFVYSGFKNRENKK